jgi:glycosyltransferase involved in cell wall biosynthesis
MKSGQLRTGLYNRHLATLGGGERYSLSIAAELSRHGQVDVISHTSVSPGAIAERLHLDLGAARLRVVPERAASALTPLSAEYDFFINASNLDFIPPQSRYSALVVYFPSPAQQGAGAGLRRTLRRRLAEHFLLPVWREGVYGESAVGEGNAGARLLAPRAVVELPVQASGCVVRFRLRSALDLVQPVVVAVNGTPTLALAAGAHYTTCRVRLPSRSGAPHTIAIVAGALGRSAPFALELAGWRVESVRNDLYRDWFAPRLPGWDSRLLNPQPDDIVAVAASYGQIWAISQFTQRWIGRYWGLPSALLYPPVDVDHFAATPAFPAGAVRQAAQRPYILSVGRFFAGQHNKQHLAMIEAFRRLVDGGLSGWELRLVGGITPGAVHARYLERVRAAAQGYPIHVEAGLPFDQLVQRYREAAVYWHAAGYGEDEERAPIKAEHFGITTVEAMAAGTVPIVIARGGQPELVTHGVDGFLWQTLDEMGAYTLVLLHDEDRRRRMAAAAVLAARRFDQAHFAATLAATLAAARIPAMTPAAVPA